MNAQKILRKTLRGVSAGLLLALVCGADSLMDTLGPGLFLALGLVVMALFGLQFAGRDS